MEKSFSEILKKYRTDNNLFQNEMSIKLGISENMYRMYENGKYNGSNKRIKIYLEKLYANNNTLSEPDSSSEYNRKKPPEEDYTQKLIKSLESQLKDKDEIIRLMREKVSRAETIEKLFVSALQKKRTLTEFHSLIESSFVS